MVDINKYLEMQLELAKKQIERKNSQKEDVSTKSKSAADYISQKQAKTLSKFPHNQKVDVKTTVTPGTSTEGHLDDIDFVPSDEEDDSIHNFPLTACSSRTKQNINRIVDDGDIKQYNLRVEVWREGLNTVKSGTYEGCTLTADIQYILDGNKDSDEMHELQNGLLVPKYIWKQLYKFQRTGVKWLWELHQVDSGGLLGDEMGLGKTIQVIAFLTALSKTNLGSWGGLGPSIIITPATVIYQWVSHFHYWCPLLRVAVLHHTGSHAGNHHKLLRDIHSAHGILLVTYAGIVKYHKELNAYSWHYLILDEGHKIRNPDTQVSKIVKKIQTPHRLLITGSPMQNSLQELWSLFDFMRPGLLGTYNAFIEHFAVPITQGGYANATEIQEATAMEIAIALKNMITPYMLRRTKAEVQGHIKLPEKNEQVLFCSLTQEQRDLYMGYLMSNTVRSILDKENKFGNPLRARLLVALSTLRKICNHPDIYLYEAQEDEEQIDEEIFGHWKRSGKMTVVNSLLKIWKKQGHRALIFSQSRVMLCLLEQYLQNQGFKYLKMDGTVNVGQRQNLIKTFNDNTDYLVFLSTTRVGGLGVNLTGADRVIIYDPDWNPATDDQAKERAWRIGQSRNVTVYRLLSAGTIEEKIYQRQIFKHFLSNKIFVDPNQKNFLTTSTLQGLFTLEELNREGDTETASIFKHTKIINKTNKNDNDLDISSKTKLEAMKRLAKEISKKISKESMKGTQESDPREEYKKKREQLLCPPKVEEPDINLVDDKITNVAFEDVLSELDIVKMHAKKDYEEQLLKSVLEDNEQDIKEVDEEKPTNIDNSQLETNESTVKDIKQKHKKSHKIKRKRRLSSSIDDGLKNLVTVKKVKKKDYSKNEVKKQTNDDDYVLNKLFAKAAVKNALQHDVVVGLAEREKKHRLKEEAAKRARNAVRAVKFSSK